MKRLSTVLFLMISVSSWASTVPLPFEEHFNNSSNWTSVYGGSSIVSDSTTPDPSNVIKFTYPSGFKEGNAPDTLYVNHPTQQELYVQYRFKLSSDYQWDPVGIDKQVYIWDTGNENFVILLWWGQLQAVTQGDGHYFWQNQGTKFVASKGIWYKVTAHIKKNTAGNSDGIVEVWVDDILKIKYTNAKFTASGNPWRSFNFTPVWGGNSGATTSSSFSILFDDVKIQTTPIGTSLPQPLLKINPSPPSSLSID